MSTYGRLSLTRTSKEHLDNTNNDAPLNEVIIQTAEGDITLSIIHVRNKQVRLGFSAPNSIKIFRTELLSPNTKKIAV